MIGIDYFVFLCCLVVDVGLFGLMVMWFLMLFVMMVLIIVLVLKIYMDFIYMNGVMIVGLVGFLSGYMLVWVGFLVVVVIL